MDAVLVTGGAGFIGSSFVRKWLAEQSLPLVNLDKLTYAGNLDSLTEVTDHPRYTFVAGDVADRALAGELLRSHRPSAVVHFAAESHVDRSIDGPDAFFRTNVLGTYELLQAVLEYWRALPDTDRECFRFLYVSTDEIYGSAPPKGWFTETSPLAPNSPYAASKAAAGHFVRAFWKTYGLPTLMTTCSNNYGPYQFPEKMIPLMILNAVEGKPLPVYGDGLHVRDWLHVEDHCNALVRTLQKGRPGEVYNIGGDSHRENLRTVEAICDIVDRLRPGLKHAPCRSLVSHVTDRPGHDRRYAVDSRKIQAELGWRPTVEFDAGLERTVRWYLDNGWWVDRVTSGKYRRERLGLLRE